jgi:hypothetical protein
VPYYLDSFSLFTALKRGHSHDTWCGHDCVATAGLWRSAYEQLTVRGYGVLWLFAAMAPRCPVLSSMECTECKRRPGRHDACERAGLVHASTCRASVLPLRAGRPGSVTKQESALRSSQQLRRVCWLILNLVTSQYWVPAKYTTQASCSSAHLNTKHQRQLLWTSGVEVW